MLKIILKKQLAEIFRSYFYDAKKNKARSKGAVIAYMVSFVVLMAGLLGGMFTALSVSLCTPLVSAGMGWLYFAIMGLIAVVLGVFGSVFNTYAGLYLAKDNDLLLSMPIPVGAIMASRILGVYIMGLMYSGIVIIPAAVVYMIQAASAAAEFIGPVLLAVLISVLVLTLSCALGWVVAQISKKLKNRSFITVIISLLFLGAYYFIYFRAQSVITDIIANAAEYGDKIRGAAYPVYLFGNAGAGDPVSMLILTAVVAVLFALMWVLISRSFIKIATATGSTGKKVLRAKPAARKSVDSALLSKEFARFTSSPNYMLNSGLGTVLLPAFGIFLLIRGGEYAALFRQVFAGHSGFVPVILTSAVCAVASMNDISAPSVSLEGKNIWIAQSLPVTPWQIIRAKLGVHLLVTGIPAVFCMACALIVGGGGDFLRVCTSVHGFLRACRDDRRAENAERSLDKRDRPHKAERSGVSHAVRSLYLCGGFCRGVFCGKGLHERRGLPCGFCSCYCRTVACNVSVDQKQRNAHFRVSVTSCGGLK